MNTLTISLPEEINEWVEKAMQNGGFSSASDYFCELVREAQVDAERERKKAELVVLLNEGLESGAPIVADDQWWDDFRAELKQEAEERGMQR